MAHLRPVAFLLGLEGMALLRAGAEDGFDGAFVDARLAEIRALCEEAVPGVFLDEGADVGRADTRTGYAGWAQTYDTEDNPLIALEDPIVRDLLADLPPGVALDAACGTGRHSATLAGLG